MFSAQVFHQKCGNVWHSNPLSSRLRGNPLHQSSMSQTYGAATQWGRIYSNSGCLFVSWPWYITVYIYVYTCISMCVILIIALVIPVYIYIIILQYVFLKIVLHYIVIHKNKSYRVTFVLFLIVQFYCAVVLMALFHCLVLFLN